MAQGSVQQGNHKERRTLVGLSNNRDPLLPKWKYRTRRNKGPEKGERKRRISLTFHKVIVPGERGREPG